MGELARFILFHTGEEDEVPPQPPGEGAIVDVALVDSAVLNE